jgi:hypothetical protein
MDPAIRLACVEGLEALLHECRFELGQFELSQIGPC